MPLSYGAKVGIGLAVTALVGGGVAAAILYSREDDEPKPDDDEADEAEPDGLEPGTSEIVTGRKYKLVVPFGTQYEKDMDKVTRRFLDMSGAEQPGPAVVLVEFTRVGLDVIVTDPGVAEIDLETVGPNRPFIRWGLRAKRPEAVSEPTATIEGLAV